MREGQAIQWHSEAVSDHMKNATRSLVCTINSGFEYLLSLYVAYTTPPRLFDCSLIAVLSSTFVINRWHLLPFCRTAAKAPIYQARAFVPSGCWCPSSGIIALWPVPDCSDWWRENVWTICQASSHANCREFNCNRYYSTMHVTQPPVSIIR